jgi:hypothetical protein
MGYQNWDDHDRSGKYTATAMAKAYLESCDQTPYYLPLVIMTLSLCGMRKIEGVH